MSAFARQVCLYVIGTCSLFSACAAEVADGDLDALEQPLLAGIDFEHRSNSQFPHWQCNREEQFAAAQAGAVGRSIAMTQAMLDCVDHSMRNAWGIYGPYRACKIDGDDEDPFPDTSLDNRIAHVKKAVRSPAPVGLTCIDGQGWATGITEVDNYNGAEHIGISDLQATYDRITDPDVAYASRLEALGEIAGSIWHEAMHSWGYWDTKCDRYKLYQTVPYIVGHCMETLVNASSKVCPQDMCLSTGRMPYVVTFEPWPNVDLLQPNEALCECARDPSELSNPTLSEPAAPVLGSNEANDRFGRAVASGDFNGDGFYDLAVGVPGENSGAGTLHLYRGSVLGLYPWKRLPPAGYSPAPGDSFGHSLAAGDFNGDGLDDLAVGAPNQGGTGRIVLFIGSERNGLSSLTSYRQAPRFGDEPGDQFGHALAAGDFDGDGLDDLAVGAPGEVVGASAKSGYVFIMRGKRSFDSDVLTMWAGVSQSPLDTNSSGDLFGASLAAGRIAGNIIDRLVVGAPGDGGVGRVFVYHSRLDASATSWSATHSLRPAGLNVFAAFGSAVAIGNYLSTGPAGVIAAGASGRNVGPITRGGAVYVFEHNGTLRQTMVRDTTDAGFGGALRTVRLNDDPYDDLVIGQATLGSNTMVQVYVGGGLLWNPTNLFYTPWHVHKAGDQFSAALAAGDFDGDGFADLAAGAEGKTVQDQARAGAVYTYRGEGDATFEPFAWIHQAH